MAEECSQAGSDEAMRQDANAAKACTGICRDIRGVCLATHNRRTYGLLFDMVYPQHFPTLLHCLEVWKHEPSVSTPILRFLAEFVHNKAQRISFGGTSANGVLLFREVSKCCVIYGGYVL